MALFWSAQKEYSINYDAAQNGRWTEHTEIATCKQGYVPIEENNL